MLMLSYFAPPEHRRTFICPCAWSLVAVFADSIAWATLREKVMNVVSLHTFPIPLLSPLAPHPPILRYHSNRRTSTRL